MMKLYLQKRGQASEAELLDAFSCRLTLSETKEQVETQVKDLLDSLSGLSLDARNQNQNASSDGLDDSCIVGNPNNSWTFYSNAPLPLPSAQQCSFMSPSTSNHPPTLSLSSPTFTQYQNHQL